MYRIDVSQEKCTGCGKCVEVCPKAPRIWSLNDKAKIKDASWCVACMQCTTVCPSEAIKIEW